MRHLLLAASLLLPGLACADVEEDLYAAYAGHDELVVALLDRRAAIDGPVEQGRSPVPTPLMEEAPGI